MCKKKKCQDFIDETARDTIHKTYWKMPSHERKLWLHSHIKFAAPKRPYAREDGSSSRRKISRIFFLPTPTLSAKETSVSQKMFLNTLGYTSDEVVKGLQKSCDFPTGSVKPDGRGRHALKHNTTNDDEEYIKSNIKKFHPHVSHYG